MCSRLDDPSMHDRGRPGWAYYDGTGRALVGPCADLECLYQSLPGGGDHDGPHSWQDGTTGWAHDYGQPCECPDCGGIDSGL